MMTESSGAPAYDPETDPALELFSTEEQTSDPGPTMATLHPTPENTRSLPIRVIPEPKKQDNGYAITMSSHDKEEAGIIARFLTQKFGADPEFESAHAYPASNNLWRVEVRTSSPKMARIFSEMDVPAPPGLNSNANTQKKGMSFTAMTESREERARSLQFRVIAPRGITQPNLNRALIRALGAPTDTIVISHVDPWTSTDPTFVPAIACNRSDLEKILHQGFVRAEGSLISLLAMKTPIKHRQQTHQILATWAPEETPSVETFDHMLHNTGLDANPVFWTRKNRVLIIGFATPTDQMTLPAPLQCGNTTLHFHRFGGEACIECGLVSADHNCPKTAARKRARNDQSGTSYNPAADRRSQLVPLPTHHIVTPPHQPTLRPELTHRPDVFSSLTEGFLTVLGAIVSRQIATQIAPITQSLNRLVAQPNPQRPPPRNQQPSWQTRRPISPANITIQNPEPQPSQPQARPLAPPQLEAHNTPLNWESAHAHQQLSKSNNTANSQFSPRHHDIKADTTAPQTDPMAAPAWGQKINTFSSAMTPEAHRPTSFRTPPPAHTRANSPTEEEQHNTPTPDPAAVSHWNLGRLLGFGQRDRPAPIQTHHTNEVGKQQSPAVRRLTHHNSALDSSQHLLAQPQRSTRSRTNQAALAANNLNNTLEGAAQAPLHQE